METLVFFLPLKKSKLFAYKSLLLAQISPKLKAMKFPFQRSRIKPNLSDLYGKYNHQ